MGRILGESDSADTSFNNTYVYDAFGQLIRENNKSLDKTFIYEYNEIGNIIAAKTYAYTTGDIGNLTPESTDTYSYDTTHKDRLSAFNGNPISYNTTGCPSSYQGVAWSWKNGRLDTISNGAFANGKSYSFTYDGYGRLKQKQYNYFPGLGVLKDYLSKKTTTYTYDTNGRLVYEYKLLQYSDNTNTYRKFTYLYDESGIVGVVYNNNGEEQTYHYSRNIKGDVIGIFDVNGAEIVKYSYDSWGNFEITTGSLTNIAKDNPILYRGYYYDHDTELYLLDARFYNPKWRRFISPDDTAYLDPETPNGLNLYAYCNNDPVNFIDDFGNTPTSINKIYNASVLTLKLYQDLLQLSIKGTKPVRISLAQAKRLARKGGHKASAREIQRNIYRYTDDVIKNTNAIYKYVDDVLRTASYAFFALDVIWTGYENYKSGDEDWLPDTVLYATANALLLLVPGGFLGTLAVAAGLYMVEYFFDDEIEKFKDDFADVWHDFWG